MFFLPEQAFFNINEMAETMAAFTLRADCGHFATQRIQEMHLSLSAFFRFSVLIACAGQFSAQSPQPTQLSFAFGTKPALPVFHNVLDASYQKIKKDLCDSLERITMEDIVADYHRSLQGGKTDRSKQQSTGQ